MKLLLLAGTREARDLSFALSGVDLISSLAGVTQRPAKLGGTLRVGGFGGISGLIRFLHDEAIEGVVDATHPFAAQMSQHAFEACRRLDVPLLRLLRPAWEVRPNWTIAPDLDAAAKMLSPGAHVFLATGRASLPHFAARPDVEFTTRVIDDLPDTFPPPKGRFLVGKPPFSVEEEIETLRGLGVSALVARNSGGTGGIEKVIAADRLGVKVIMVSRPALPDVPLARSVEEAVQMIEVDGWLDG